MISFFHFVRKEIVIKRLVLDLSDLVTAVSKTKVIHTGSHFVTSYLISPLEPPLIKTLMKQFFLFFTLLVFTIACKSTKNDPEPLIPEDVEYIDLDIDGKKTKWLTSDTTVFVTRIKRYAHYGDELKPIIGFTFEFRHKPYSGAPLKEYEKITLNFNKKLILEKPVRSNDLMCQYTKSGVFENYFNCWIRSSGLYTYICIPSRAAAFQQNTRGTRKEVNEKRTNRANKLLFVLFFIISFVFFFLILCCFVVSYFSFSLTSFQ